MLGICSKNPISYYIASTFPLFWTFRGWDRRVGDKVSVILAKGPTKHILSVKSFTLQPFFSRFLVFSLCVWLFCLSSCLQPWRFVFTSLPGSTSHCGHVWCSLQTSGDLCSTLHSIGCTRVSSCTMVCTSCAAQCTCLVFEGTGPWTVFTHPCWGRADSQQWCWFSKITSRPHL